MIENSSLDLQVTFAEALVELYQGNFLIFHFIGLFTDKLSGSSGIKR